METSAKASINVEDAFFTLARDIKVNMEKRLEDWAPVIRLVDKHEAEIARHIQPYWGGG